VDSPSCEKVVVLVGTVHILLQSRQEPLYNKQTLRENLPGYGKNKSLSHQWPCLKVSRASGGKTVSLDLMDRFINIIITFDDNTELIWFVPCGNQVVYNKKLPQSPHGAQQIKEGWRGKSINMGLRQS